jgi:hypothetical protein
MMGRLRTTALAMNRSSASFSPGNCSRPARTRSNGTSVATSSTDLPAQALTNPNCFAISDTADEPSRSIVNP